MVEESPKALESYPRKHPCQLTIDFTYKNKTFTALIDSGATNDFMDEKFCIEMGIMMRKRRHGKALHLLDAAANRSTITHTVKVRLDLHAPFGPVERRVFQVTRLAAIPIILGIPWLQQHDPVISWSDMRILPRGNDEVDESAGVEV